MRIQKPSNNNGSNAFSRDDEPLRFNNITNFNNEDEKFPSPEIIEDKEKFEKIEYDNNNNRSSAHKDKYEEKKLENEKNEELLVFNLKYIKPSLINNVQVTIFSPLYLLINN